MSKRNAEAETADGSIPDEPKEKAAKLDEKLDATTDEETPLLDADAEAIKHAAEEEHEHPNNKAAGDEDVADEEEGIINENDAKENGEEPIIDEPDDEEEHNNIHPNDEHEEGEEEEVQEEGEVEEKEGSNALKEGSPPTELPDDVKDVEFKVPHLPTKSHGDEKEGDEAATHGGEAKVEAEANGST